MYKMQQTNIKYCAVPPPPCYYQLLTVSHYKEITSVDARSYIKILMSHQNPVSS